MASYLRQSGQIALLLSEAEAEALLAIAMRGEKRGNGQVIAAADRALNALSACTNRNARRAGFFDKD